MFPSRASAAKVSLEKEGAKMKTCLQANLTVRAAMLIMVAKTVHASTESALSLSQNVNNLLLVSLSTSLTDIAPKWLLFQSLPSILFTASSSRIPSTVVAVSVQAMVLEPILLLVSLVASSNRAFERFARWWGPHSTRWHCRRRSDKALLTGTEADGSK